MNSTRPTPSSYAATVQHIQEQQVINQSILRQAKQNIDQIYEEQASVINAQADSMAADQQQEIETQHQYITEREIRSQQNEAAFQSKQDEDRQKSEYFQKGFDKELEARKSHHEEKMRLQRQELEKIKAITNSNRALCGSGTSHYSGMDQRVDSDPQRSFSSNYFGETTPASFDQQDYASSSTGATRGASGGATRGASGSKNLPDSQNACLIQ